MIFLLDNITLTIAVDVVPTDGHEGRQTDPERYYAVSGFRSDGGFSV